jgi:hypothetical protein
MNTKLSVCPLPLLFSGGAMGGALKINSIF